MLKVALLSGLSSTEDRDFTEDYKPTQRGDNSILNWTVKIWSKESRAADKESKSSSFSEPQANAADPFSCLKIGCMF